MHSQSTNLLENGRSTPGCLTVVCETTSVLTFEASPPKAENCANEEHRRQRTVQMRRGEVEDLVGIMLEGDDNNSFVVSLFSVFVLVLLFFCFA